MQGKKSEPATSVQQHAQNKLCTLSTMLKRKKCEINALGMDKEDPWQGWHKHHAWTLRMLMEHLNIMGKWLAPRFMGPGVALLVGRSRDRFPVASLDFSVTYFFRPHHGPGVDPARSENEYQEHFLGVKVPGAWGWWPYHLHVPNIMKIWEPKPPVTLWATPGLLRASFTFTHVSYSEGPKFSQVFLGTL